MCDDGRHSKTRDSHEASFEPMERRAHEILRFVDAQHASSNAEEPGKGLADGAIRFARRGWT